jgi:hypothetical protein
MRERGVSTLGGILLATLAGMVTAALIMDWVVVDVHTPAPDAFHIKVPFPLVVGHVATAFIPDDVMAEAVVPPEVRQHRELVLTAVQSLLETPDATLVKVRADDAHVDIRKQGDDLVVAVEADDASVRCTVPLDGVLDALDDWDWETFDPGMMFDILGAVNHGELVTVEAEDGTRVAVKIW